MSEQETKLNEAKFFYRKMSETAAEENYYEFVFYLSAFLTPARSVLQYTYEHAKTLGKLSEYTSLVSSDPILSFFKDKRDFNIHNAPVTTIREVRVDLDSFIVIRDPNAISEPLKESLPPENGGLEISTVYKFEDWNDEDNIIDLSYEYVLRLESFINDAKSLGLIV